MDIREHKRAQQVQSCFFRIRVADYFDVLAEMNKIDGESLESCRDMVWELVKGITENHLYSFADDNDTDHSDITIGEVMLAVSSLYDRIVDCDPEDMPFEEPVEEMYSTVSMMLETLIAPLIILGRELKKEAGISDTE